VEIVKFGGSSMANATTINLCCEIINSNHQAQIIVVSAPGIYGKYKTKVTDELIQYTKSSENLKSVINRFNEIAKELLTPSKYLIFKKILKNTSDAIHTNNYDYNFIVSRGEYLSAKLLALHLNYNFIDAQDILIINPDATINLEATKKQIKKYNLKQFIPFVIGGFYGQSNGKIALFTRGGSDYTGAILAVLMKASIYNNYTDSYGIQTANPSLVYNTETIPCLDFQSLDILTHNGAGIIHENVAQLLETFKVPLRVDNTFDPNKKFTEVHSPRCRNCQHNFFCVTHKNNQILILKRKNNGPIITQKINTTQKTVIEDMQKIHNELLKKL